MLALANSHEPLPVASGGQGRLADANRHGKPGKKVMKRPAAAVAHGDEADRTPKAKKTGNQQAQVSAEKKPKTKATISSIDALVKAGKKLSTSNCRELKNHHSKAYHKSLATDLAKGVDETTAKEQAREAANKAKDEFILAHTVGK